MEKLELLRQKLYLEINKGNYDEILRLSRELDEEIVVYIKQLESELKDKK